MFQSAYIVLIGRPISNFGVVWAMVYSAQYNPLKFMASTAREAKGKEGQYRECLLENEVIQSDERRRKVVEMIEFAPS